MTKKSKPLAAIVASYQNNVFKPENFQKLGRIFGNSATIDIHRLTCQHRENVASAYMRGIRRKKARQQDVYFNKMQNIPMKIRRVAVKPDYQDPYTSFNNRLPKLGYDPTMAKPFNVQVNPEGKSYVSHNTLSPHINILFKTNRAGYPNKGTKPPPVSKSSQDVEAEASSPQSPRRSKPRLCALSNIPRHSKTIWNFNVPSELNNGGKNTHINSIPQSKHSMAAINSVHKHNKPVPAIVAKA